MVENNRIFRLRTQPALCNNKGAIALPPLRSSRAGNATQPTDPTRMTTLMVEPAAREFLVEYPSVAETQGAFSIVRVRPRHEKVFVRELRAEAIGFYLPLRLHKRYWRGRKREAWVPMFGGLVFVANGADGRMVAANSRCVNGFVPVAASYQPQLRRELIQLETVLSHQPDAEAFPELQQGREVEVRHDCGHWAARLRGKIVRRENRDVFVVLIQILGREVEVGNIPGELLEVISDAA